LYDHLIFKPLLSGIVKWPSNEDWCRHAGDMFAVEHRNVRASLKELEKENGKLKRLVADLSLDKQILKDIAEGNF
jgi:hypothetical protein